MLPWAHMGPIWGHIWAHMGPHGLHGPWPMGLGRWALADWPRGPPHGVIFQGQRTPHGGIFQGPRPMGLEDPPMGVYFRARGRWGPMGSMGLGDPPMGVSSSKYPYYALKAYCCLFSVVLYWFSYDSFVSKSNTFPLLSLVLWKSHVFHKILICFLDVLICFCYQF